MIGQEAGQLRVRGDKTVNTVTRLGVSVMCSMDLALYPHDTQVGPGVFTIMKEAPIRAFCWLKAPIKSTLVGAFSHPSPSDCENIND